MRSLRVTQTAWFGPRRRLGWGWSITNWRGLLATGAFVALQGSVTFWRGSPGRWTVWSLVAAHLTLAAAFLLLMVLTGDPPGGPRCIGGIVSLSSCRAD
jgi:hypothetical protein